MAAATDPVFDCIVVEEELVFSLSALCQATGASPAQVVGLVDEGVLQPAGATPQQWVFSGPSLRATRTALRLSTDLELGPAGAALVLELLDEIDTLKARLRRHGLQ